MSTRNFNNPEGSNPPEDFELPSCTIEDVDRSLFDLFNNQLPFMYKRKKGTKRAPVIFATGERFAVLRRREPLRDKSGALVLPLISIMRTGISQNSTIGMGTNQNAEHVIKKRLSPEDPVYQRFVNKQNLQNSDDLAAKPALVKTSGAGFATGSVEGRIASRADRNKKDLAARRNISMDASLNNNIYEIITMRAPNYFTATYEVTFWAQYTIQMNDMINALMSLYQSYSQRAFKLETPKGYWFVGYVAENLSPGNNFDDFTDSERLVRYSFEVTVPAYLIGDTYPGSQNTLRKYVSAPFLSFDMNVINKDFSVESQSGIPSGNPEDYLMEDTRAVDEPIPGSSLFNRSSLNDSRHISEDRSIYWRSHRKDDCDQN